MASTCAEHAAHPEQQPACTDSPVLRLRRQLRLLRVASAIALPLTLISEGLPRDAAATGMAAPLSAVPVEATLRHSAYVQLNERAMPGGAFAPADKELENFDSSQANEAAGDRLEFQMIRVPRIAF